MGWRTASVAGRDAQRPVEAAILSPWRVAAGYRLEKRLWARKPHENQAETP